MKALDPLYSYALPSAAAAGSFYLGWQSAANAMLTSSQGALATSLVATAILFITYFGRSTIRTAASNILPGRTGHVWFAPDRLQVKPEWLDSTYDATEVKMGAHAPKTSASYLGNSIAAGLGFTALVLMGVVANLHMPEHPYEPLMANIATVPISIGSLLFLRGRQGARYGLANS